jgi:hypothetical protein
MKKKKLLSGLVLLTAMTPVATWGEQPIYRDQQPFSPKIQQWFKSAKTPSGGDCCDLADGHRENVAELETETGQFIVRFTEWGTYQQLPAEYQAVVRPGNYWVRYRYGKRSYLLDAGSPDRVIKDNPTGTAVVWIVISLGKPLVRCFSPGPGS